MSATSAVVTQQLQNAGIKYTDLPPATLPLAGTEIAALVQNGRTVQAPTSSLLVGIANRVVFVSPGGASNNVNAGIDANTRYLDVDTTAGAAQWSGLSSAGISNGQRIVVTPIGAGSLRLDALNGASAAANQFRAAANTMLVTNLSVEIEFSSGVGKWLVIP